MKTALLPVLAVLMLGLNTSCTTTYDAAGRPVSSVTPEGAAVAALAAGVIGYAIADSDRNDHRHHSHRRHSSYYHDGYGYYGGGGYRGARCY